MADEVKACPSCGESIQAAAVLCRFCKYDFRTGAVPGAPPPARKAFPWLVVGLVVCGGGCLLFVPIIAAIAIPGLLAAQRASNERHASANMLVFVIAENDFRTNDRDGNRIDDYWVRDVRGLYETTKGSGVIEKKIADADATTGAAVPFGGYLYAAVPLQEDGKPYDNGSGHNVGRFAFCAFPAKYGSAGRLTFIVDEYNRVWKKDTQGQPVAMWPSDPRAEGWLSVDYPVRTPSAEWDD